MRKDENITAVISRTLHLLDEIEEKAMRPGQAAGYSLRQVYYLDTVSKLNTPTLSQLADVLNVSKPTVTVAVNSLIKDGLIEKKQDNSDKRAFHLILTEKGRRLISAHEQAHQEFVGKLIEHLSESEKKQLAAIFLKISGKLLPAESDN